MKNYLSRNNKFYIASSFVVSLNTAVFALKHYLSPIQCLMFLSTILRLGKNQHNVSEENLRRLIQVFVKLFVVKSFIWFIHLTHLFTLMHLMLFMLLDISCIS